jgi:AcrR family transcriptional regulator
MMVAELKASPDSPLAPRKQPQQKRARATVDNILQAAEELVRARGFSEVGTRQIAERAGVSIGSLYQYFPTYESILLAWYENVATAAARRLKLDTMEILDKDLETSIRYCINTLFKVYEDHTLELIRMPREVPEIERATRSISFENLNRAAMRLFFNQHHEFNPRETERHIFFLETIIMSVLRRYVIERPANLKRAIVLEQVCGMVSAYLRANVDPKSFKAEFPRAAPARF